MMKKRVLTALLAVVLLLPLFTGCRGNGSGAKTLGDTNSRDPLRICIDVAGPGTPGREDMYAAVNDLLISLKQTVGLTDVVVEVVPGIYYDNNGHPESTAARESTINRLRVEIMSGGGPDVFIMNYAVLPELTGNGYDGGNTLFRHPEKIMENGVFLPLDDYMENNTRFAEWDKFTKPVLEAGRNEEGQQIIPLTYTLPVLYMPKSTFDYTPDMELTWDDMLHDSALSPFAADLANCYLIDMTYDYKEIGSCQMYLEYILGELMDTENEKLAFTEEELLQRINEILALDRTESYRDIGSAEEKELSTRMAERYNSGRPMTMLPLYSDDGGITAHIQNYAAINRNTKKPDEAYAVIDLLMSKKMQMDKPIYSKVLYSFCGIPLHEDLFREDTPLGRWDYLTDENYKELSELRGQITHANFKSELTYMVNGILVECESADVLGKTVEEIVHEAYEEMERRVRE